MPKRKPTTEIAKTQAGLLAVCRLHFVFVAVYAVYIIAADATQLITAESVLQRWAANAGLLAGTALIWYLARSDSRSIRFFRLLIWAVVLMDIALATFSVYTQRGMAARSVMLFAVPIAVACLLRNRRALFFTATLCTAAYSSAAVKYFVDFFNEGYKAELYIEVGFYCAVFFGLAALLSLIVQPGSKNQLET